MYQITFYVPQSHLELVKKAMFKRGAGRMGNYAECAWAVLGKGQFKPLAGSDPFVGTIDQIEYVDEYKVEMMCADENIVAAIQAMKQVHPYETPAYSVWRLSDAFNKLPN